MTNRQASVLRESGWCLRLAMLAFIAWSGARLSAQSLIVSTVSDALHVRASGIAFGFIKGVPLNRLKDGRSVRFDFELAVLAKPLAPVVTENRQSFVLSYDLWEERFAVTQIGAPEAVGTMSHSISHLTSTDAEAWCLEHLTVPLSALGRLGRDRPFWIRLAYRVLDRDRAPDSAFTLPSLIDMLSRRRKTDELKGSIEAGPFRLTN